MNIEDRRTLEEQLTIAQIAERLSVDDSTVRRWIRAGQLCPVRKLGRRIVRLPASAVNRFLQARTLPNTAKPA